MKKLTQLEQRQQEYLSMQLQHESAEAAYMQALNNIGKNKMVLDHKTALIKSQIRSYKRRTK